MFSVLKSFVMKTFKSTQDKNEKKNLHHSLTVELEFEEQLIGRLALVKLVLVVVWTLEWEAMVDAMRPVPIYFAAMEFP